MKNSQYALLAFLLSFLVINSSSQQIGGSNYVQRQLLCALDAAPCDSFGQQVKDALPEILGRNCQSCNRRQNANAKRIATFIQSRYPDAWEALVQKYASAAEIYSN